MAPSNTNNFNRTRTYKLKFEGTELDGLVASMLPLSIAGHIRLEDLLNAGRQLGNEEIVEFCTLVAGRLHAWNYTVDDEPVPTTPEGLLDHVDLPFLLLFVVRWLQSITGVAVPLALKGEKKASPAADSTSPLTPESLAGLDALSQTTAPALDPNFFARNGNGEETPS